MKKKIFYYNLDGDAKDDRERATKNNRIVDAYEDIKSLSANVGYTLGATFPRIGKKLKVKEEEIKNPYVKRIKNPYK